MIAIDKIEINLFIYFVESFYRAFLVLRGISAEILEYGYQKLKLIKTKKEPNFIYKIWFF